MVEKGKYDKHLLKDYTREELELMDQFIDHRRDLDFSYAAVKQLEGKYFVQNRVTAKSTKVRSSSIFWLRLACLRSIPKRHALITSSVSTMRRRPLRSRYLHRLCRVYVLLLVSSALAY